MNSDDDELDDFFRAAREDAPRVSDDLTARLLEDAADNLPRAADRIPHRGLRQNWSALWLGGGLAAAGLLGVAIGLAAPEELNGLILGKTDGLILSEIFPAADPALMLEDGT